ncbi:Caspase recruitment domain-containing protein 6 [Cricetulus griseus]|uniref:Caspase recruitment domain-containing protein 6 n=1 Tax=Cricetulus griseus TaxID=10029 RepID=G3HHG6_CRIGR|nr:Caspase recruitment domain-containing protein 6 [Cricetulus griseus]
MSVSMLSIPVFATSLCPPLRPQVCSLCPPHPLVRPHLHLVSFLSEKVPQQVTEAAWSLVGREDAADPYSFRRKTSENEEIAELSEEKECVDWETSESFMYEESSHVRETAGSSRESKHSLGRVEYEVPTSITYLNDGQRHEEPDDSLYLGEGEYEESVGYPEDVETIVEEGDFDDLECFVYDGEEEREYEETMGLSHEESCEASESGISLEEEERRTEGMETM